MFFSKLNFSRKRSDRKSATTFQVRYRSQNDPLIHDEEATDFVLAEVDAPNKPNPKVKTTSELASELGLAAEDVRHNEGEAAMHGVYFDDSKYDYMQHMRDMGATEAVFIEAPQAESKQRRGRNKKQTLDEAIEELGPKSMVVTIPRELLPSEVQVKRSYQDQQDIPDAIGGFQPDMDPRIREVLEALEDEEYVDDDEDVFAALTADGETTAGCLDGDGWESDTTEKGPSRHESPIVAGAGREGGEAGEEAPNHDWTKEFSRFMKAQKEERKKKALGDDDISSLADTTSFGESSVVTAGTISVSGRRRRRREKKNGGGADTATSGYSMSSSALFRTEGLTLLDDRFEKVCFLFSSFSCPCSPPSPPPSFSPGPD